MESRRDGETSSAADLSKEINKTYVISAITNCTAQRNTTCDRGKLSLQKRKTGYKGTQESAKTLCENTENNAQVKEKRLTLQRRTRTHTMDRNVINTSKASERTGPHSSQLVNPKVLSEPNSRTPRGTAVLRSVSLKDSGYKSKGKDTINHDKMFSGTEGSTLCQEAGTQLAVNEMDTLKTGDRDKVFSTPTRKTPFEKVSLKKDMFERLAGRGAPNAAAAISAKVEKQRKPGLVSVGGVKALPQNAAQSGVFSFENRDRNLALSSQTTQLKNGTSSGQTVQLKNGKVPVTSSGNCSESATGCLITSGRTRTSTESSSEDGLLKQDFCKTENSAITVAVRLRPFSGREKNEKTQQVVFMNNQETLVQYPDSKQCYSFMFDFSFCSIDEMKSGFASQQTVYEKLARPLLERAFEGYNTCLFAYGQTGSGKSYTMMGFDEEPGVVPRFCEEIYSRMTNSENKQITCHLEMSYFEVYNEKIHDLLVVKDDQSQKKLPLRVREHPVYGPYVADLSTNVVSSYADIQGWLELGNKQRATAATGMNDKSSRSHCVFTLIMTQTKTEFVEEEEHDHRITSRINLVDLAGSERSSSAQTSGERLREGASINKSLLTLGKVISALSEQFQSRKRVFIPYRESVLTWLLKESLGGNSKTAMIATLSPAASSIEETLSTLRYAKQARMIINVAKVNEDTNAKLIRELKAEVEKLKAAQMSSQGIDPKKMRLFQQEIAALRMQLTQQQKEMAEAHRTWKEKLEQAEKRKQVETKELQKAGITFKVDNQLPNLVNLNEDPQLSEMLLYMIKEGETKVGKHKSESAHDIQLCGALIADQHCVISNRSGIVSIIPVKDAKTFVNGHLISSATVLCHGDRVILGGDHYFRFNHPVEVHNGKRVSCWNGTGDGHKDFEFAKNELLAAQRAQLEAEIEQARLKAKEEMMQGIQVAKEMAQKELSDQKAQYEDRIRTLERELEEESQRKKCQELNNQRVASKVEELQSANILLEQKLQVNKTRLHLEAQAARQAMADHDIRHAKLIEALEAEKQKIAEDLERIQKRVQPKENHAARNTEPHWDAMKLSVMIEEANTISRKLSKNTLFSRHECSDKESRDGEVELPIQVQNTRLGISTFWSLEKFQSKLARMRELEQGECGSKDDDLFYDPNDEWEQDISVSLPASKFSRRRSRSLLKSRRISGRLYEIRVHPIQSLLSSSQHAGLMGVNKPPSPLQQSMPNLVLPGVCKDLIGSALAQLQGCHSAEVTMADKLTSDLFTVHTAVESICSLFERLDDDSQDNLFASSREAQMQLVRATSAIERAVIVTMLWMSSIKQNSTAMFQTADRLKSEVKKMGGYFQLLIQGCDSEISSMVTEAQSKTSECLDEALRSIAHLSAVMGTELHVAGVGSEAIGKQSVTVALYEGTCRGVATLVQEGINLAKEMHRQALRVVPSAQILQNLKKDMSEVASSLQNSLSSSILQEGRTSNGGSSTNQPDLLSARTKAAVLFQLNMAVRQLHCSLTQILKEKDGGGDFVSQRKGIHSSSRTITDAISELFEDSMGTCAAQSVLPCADGVRAVQARLLPALQSLLATLDKVYDKSVLPGGESTGHGDGSRGEDVPVSGSTMKNRNVRKVVYTFSSQAKSSPSDIQWV